MAILTGVMQAFRCEFYFVVFVRSCRYNIVRKCATDTSSFSSENETSFENDKQFRVLSVLPPETTAQKKPARVIKMPTPRESSMLFDQDWTNVWPGPKIFNPATVPLPLRQGYMKNKKAPPEKYANTELMKIPNFLHLTEKAIQKHCKALKKFCTEWPESLKDEQLQEKYFPIQIIHSDYCHSTPTIRDPLARILTLKIKLKTLNLDKHATDKFLRLVGSRYDPETDIVTITTDSCPLKTQNYDYAQYLLTALYYESQKFEDWEKDKADEDMENYRFSERKSFKNIKKLFDYNNKDMPDVKEYAAAVENWHDQGDKPEVISDYKKACLKLLNLPALD